MTFSTSDVAVCCPNASESCSNASSRSRRRHSDSLSAPAVEELLLRDASAEPRFGISALRLRALASLLLALERRLIAYPKAQDYADLQRGLQQGFAAGEMGFGDQVAQPHS